MKEDSILGNAGNIFCIILFVVVVVVLNLKS